MCLTPADTICPQRVRRISFRSGETFIPQHWRVFIKEVQSQFFQHRQASEYQRPNRDTVLPIAGKS